MATLMVSAAGQVLLLPASPGSGGVDVTEVLLYMQVATGDGSPVAGLSGGNFSVTLFTSPDSSVDVPTTAPELDDEKNPVLDSDGNPKMESLVRPLSEPGVDVLDGAVRGLSAQAFLVAC